MVYLSLQNPARIIIRIRISKSHKNTCQLRMVAADQSCVGNGERGYSTHHHHIGTKRQEKERETQGDMEMNSRD